MKIVVLSDTHRAVHPALDAVLEQRPDAVIHLGDCVCDADDIAAAFPQLPLYSVAGNNDFGTSAPLCRVIELSGARLYLTHGHMENVGQDLQRLYYKALENDCIGALFGHTHRGVFTEIDGVYLMNPGSLSRPRDGSGGSFGIIETDDDQVCGKIYRYKEFTEGQAAGPSGGLRPKSGRLRRLLNDSDRL